MNSFGPTEDSPGLRPPLGMEARAVTLLFTDLVDSTKLNESLGDKRFSMLMAMHDEMMRFALAAHRGTEIDRTDGFFAVFDRPVEAVGCALAYHKAIAELAGREGVGLAARAAIHHGELFFRRVPEHAYGGVSKPVEAEGLAKPLGARLLGLADSGQTLLTREAYAIAMRASTDPGALPLGTRWIEHGTYCFKGVATPMEVYEVGIEGIAPMRPPSSKEKAWREGQTRPAGPSQGPPPSSPGPGGRSALAVAHSRDRIIAASESPPTREAAAVTTVQVGAALLMSGATFLLAFSISQWAASITHELGEIAGLAILPLVLIAAWISMQRDVLTPFRTVLARITGRSGPAPLDSASQWAWEMLSHAYVSAPFLLLIASTGGRVQTLLALPASIAMSVAAMRGKVVAATTSALAYLAAFWGLERLLALS